MKRSGGTQGNTEKQNFGRLYLFHSFSFGFCRFSNKLIGKKIQGKDKKKKKKTKNKKKKRREEFGEQSCHIKFFKAST